MPPTNADHPELNRPDSVAAVTEVFGRYESAVIANDVETLIELCAAGARRRLTPPRSGPVRASSYVRYRPSMTARKQRLPVTVAPELVEQLAAASDRQVELIDP